MFAWCLLQSKLIGITQPENPENKLLRKIQKFRTIGTGREKPTHGKLAHVDDKLDSAMLRAYTLKKLDESIQQLTSLEDELDDLTLKDELDRKLEESIHQLTGLEEKLDGEVPQDKAGREIEGKITEKSEIVEDTEVEDEDKDKRREHKRPETKKVTREVPREQLADLENQLEDSLQRLTDLEERLDDVASQAKAEKDQGKIEEIVVKVEKDVDKEEISHSQEEQKTSFCLNHRSIPIGTACMKTDFLPRPPRKPPWRETGNIDYRFCIIQPSSVDHNLGRLNQIVLLRGNVNARLR